MPPDLPAASARGVFRLHVRVQGAWNKTAVVRTPGKSELRIYDYVDSQVPVLRRMFAKRVKAYQAMDYALDSP